MSSIVLAGSPVRALFWLGLVLAASLLLGHWICARSGKSPWVITGILAVTYSAILIYMASLTRSVTITYAGGEMEIEAGGYRTAIKPDDVLWSQIVILDALSDNPELRTKWRTSGIGLPGYACGWFRLAGGKSAFASLIGGVPVVVIPLKSSPDYLLLSAEQPAQLVADLNALVGTPSTVP